MACDKQMGQEYFNFNETEQLVKIILSATGNLARIVFVTDKYLDYHTTKEMKIRGKK